MSFRTWLDDRRTVPVLLALVLFFVAIAVNFSGIQRYHDSDSVLLAFISIDRWLPFYWGDNRYGMPVPLLVSFIRDIRWNLLAQTQIFAFAAVWVVAVSHLFFFHEKEASARTRLACACLSLPLLLLSVQSTAPVYQVFLLAHPYLISFAMVLPAVALLLRINGSLWWRFPLAIVLIALGLWLNYSMVLPTVALIALLPDAEKTWTATIPRRAAAIVLTFLILWELREWATQFPNLGNPNVVPLPRWFDTAAHMTQNMFQVMVRPFVFLAILATGVVSGFYGRKRRMFVAADLLTMVGTAAAFAICVSATDWPARNQYDPRYWAASLTLILLPATACLSRGFFELMSSVTQSRVVAAGLAALILVASTLSQFGFPSVAVAFRALDESTGHYGASSERLGCTHFTGAYVMTWMTAFYMRAHGHPNAYALSLRSNVVRDLWDKMPLKERTYCSVCVLPQEFNFWRSYLKLPDMQFKDSDGEVCRFLH